jgi:hypothetical protein
LAWRFVWGRKKLERLRAALLIATLLVPGQSPAIDPGWAKGRLVTARGEVALTHAYALEHRDEEGVGGGAELRILLADREVRETLLSGPLFTAVERECRDRGLRGVLLRLDPQRLAAAPVRVAVLEAAPESPPGLHFVTLPGGSAGLEPLRVDPTRVTGKARRVRGGGAGEFGYDATFSAPRFVDVVTERLSGPRAATSAPALALLEAEHAAVGATSDQRRRAGRVVEVVVRGDRASVVVQEKGGRRVSVLVQQDGVWKVD